MFQIVKKVDDGWTDGHDLHIYATSHRIKIILPGNQTFGRFFLYSKNNFLFSFKLYYFTADTYFTLGEEVSVKNV